MADGTTFPIEGWPEHEAIVTPDGIEVWRCGDPVASVPPDWGQAELDAFLTGRHSGFADGERCGRNALALELRRLLGAAPHG